MACGGAPVAVGPAVGLGGAAAAPAAIGVAAVDGFRVLAALQWSSRGGGGGRSPTRRQPPEVGACAKTRPDAAKRRSA